MADPQNLTDPGEWLKRQSSLTDPGQWLAQQGQGVPGMELLGGTPPPAPKPPNALRPSVKMTNRDGQITDAGANVPMGTAAKIATAPLEATKGLLESSGKNVTTGVKRMNAGAKSRSAFNPLPSSEELGGMSDVVRGVGEAGLPLALGSNLIGTTKAIAAGVPTSMAVEGTANALGVPQGASQFIGDAAGLGAGAKAPELFSGAKAGAGNARAAVTARLERIDPFEGIVQGLKPGNNRTGFPASLERSLPELKATEPELPNKKIASVNDLLDAIDIAKKRVWGQYRAITGPQAKSYADASPVADAMDASIPDQLKFEKPNEAKALQQEANVYRKPLTVEQMESFLKTTNAQLDAYYAKNPLMRRVAKGQNPETAALEAKADALRNVLYNATDAEGEGAAPAELKRRYGALLEMERSAWPRRNVADRQQPNSLAQQVGKMAGYGQMAKGGIKLLTGNLGGAADVAAGLTEKQMATWMKEQQTTDNLIRRSFANYQGSPTPVQTPPPFQPKGLLTKGDIITPPPADRSGGGAQPLAPHQQVNRMRPALPPGTAPFTQGTSVPDMTAPAPQIHNQLPQGPRFMGPSELGGRAGDITDTVPVVNPATGRIEYIPRFAKGGTIHRPTLLSDLKTGAPTGLMAEAGPERIVPIGNPNEPTAAKSTIPERPDTMRLQLDQLSQGARKVVMFPRGTPLLKRPKGMQAYQDASGNSYIFDPSAISTDQIDTAIEKDDLPSILGAADGGMGAPDKSKLTPPVEAVVGRDADGTTAQATATDAGHEAESVWQTKKVTPHRGTVRVEPASREIKRRIKFPSLRAPSPVI